MYLVKLLSTLALALASADGLMFHLEPNSRKCLKEEIHKQALVTGEYEISPQPNQQVDLMVVDTKGQVRRVENEVSELL